MTLHKCILPQIDAEKGPTRTVDFREAVNPTVQGYGPAVRECVEEDTGHLWVGNDEYGSRVNFCPVCGYKSKKPYHVLTVQDGYLAFKGEKILYVSQHGEPDHIAWPFVDDGISMLISALFDRGNISNDDHGEVFLPGDQLFGEIVPCGFNPTGWVVHKWKEKGPSPESVRD